MDSEFFKEYNSLNQMIKCLNQIINENKPYNLRLCTFTFHKFQEKKNLNLVEVAGISKGEFEDELEKEPG